jgi:hypothetical protein
VRKAYGQECVDRGYLLVLGLRGCTICGYSDYEIEPAGTASRVGTPSSGRHHYSTILARPVDTSDRLLKISQFYQQEAKRCAAHRAYSSACILAAAALEAMLLSMCYIEDRQVRFTVIYRQKKFRSKRNRFLEFNLFQLIEVAAELKARHLRAGTQRASPQNLGAK